MGAYACLWVHWGIGGTGNTKTRQRGGNYGHTDPDLGPVVGKISEHHVLSNKNKMGVNGPGWVSRGSHEHNRVYLHGETRKQGEMGGKSAIRTHFAGVVTGKKTTRSWQVWSRGSERIQGGNYGTATGSRCDTIGY